MKCTPFFTGSYLTRHGRINFMDLANTDVTNYLQLIYKMNFTDFLLVLTAEYYLQGVYITRHGKINFVDLADSGMTKINFTVNIFLFILYNLFTKIIFADFLWYLLLNTLCREFT